MNSFADKQARRRRILLLVSKFGTIIGLIIMVLAFTALEPKIFPTFRNFKNIVNQASLSAIIGCGLTVALIVGEMDLSVAYLASFAGVLATGLMVKNQVPVIPSMLIVLAVSAFIGLVNGLIITKLKVNAVVATLGTGSIVVGLNYAYAQGVPIASGLPEAFKQLAIGHTLSIPNNIVIIFICLLDRPHTVSLRKNPQ